MPSAEAGGGILPLVHPPGELPELVGALDQEELGLAANDEAVLGAAQPQLVGHVQIKGCVTR